MTGAAHQASTQEISARATDFLERREFDSWADRDEAELHAWLAESKAHCAAFWRLEAAWGRTHRLAALRSERLKPAFLKSSPRPALGRLRMVVGTVITVFGIAAGTYVVWPHDSVYQTSVGGRETLTLADGSSIELNTDTVLRTHITANSRSATLVRGEAYFRIHHDSRHPFVVIAGTKKITDLGTAFAVRNDNGGVRVALFEGSAQLNAGGKPFVLVPGDKVVATATATTLSHGQPQTLMTDLGWRRGVVIFKRTTLAEVATEFNRYNNTKLVIADPQTARLTVGGTFPANNIQLFGRMASAILGLHVTKRGDQIVISR